MPSHTRARPLAAAPSPPPGDPHRCRTARTGRCGDQPGGQRFEPDARMAALDDIWEASVPDLNAVMMVRVGR